MSVSYYKNTARKAKTKTQTIFAFGRDDELHGMDPDLGGYAVFKLCENYDGNVRGGIRKTMRLVKGDLSFVEAVRLINKRLHYKAFEEEIPEKVKKAHGKS